MELKLNIYDKNTIVKTYTAENYRIKMGTIEEIISLIDIEKFSNVDLTDAAAIANDNAVLMEIVKIVLKAFDKISPLMMDVFEGLTREECGSTDPVEIAVVIREVFAYTFGELVNAISTKN